MKVFFGLEFDEVVFHQEPNNQIGGLHEVGTSRFFDLLEQYCGTKGLRSENVFLRVEQYRQSIKKYAKENPNAFYSESLQSDELGTATALLSMRDELLLSGMRFNTIDENAPERIKCLKEIENIPQGKLTEGLADRFVLIKEILPHINIPFTQIHINEPKELLPHYLIWIFDCLEEKGISVHYSKQYELSKDATDLACFRNRFINKELAKKKENQLQKDGSIIILKCKRETEAANFLAQLFKLNPSLRPLTLIPEKNRSLDNALIQEGIPSMGILSASLGRPSLQILKLITGFLWNPIDPYKILEFLSLSMKPLDDKLAYKLAQVMSVEPGMNGELWRSKVAQFFNEEENEKNKLKLDEAREQYNFWFQRRRYSAERSVPVKDVIEVYEYLENWAGQEFERQNKNTSLLVLKEQAKKIKEVLEELPETEQTLSFLKLERIIRTVYEPAPVSFREVEKGHIPFIYKNSAIISETKDLLWWNFTDHERDYFFSKWYPTELKYAAEMNWHISTPEIKNKLSLWQRNLPIIKTQHQLILVIPEKVSGTQVPPHSLEGDLKACFGDLSPISIELETEENLEFLEQFFTVPKRENANTKLLGKKRNFLEVQLPKTFLESDTESYSSLDDLFYYPYKWVFKHKIKLKNSSLLSVVKEHTLMGNLAHDLFENILKEDIQNWTQNDVHSWIDNTSQSLLERKGAVLLMYGKESEKVAFIRKVKNAAWTLIDMIQKNGWKIRGTEIPLTGKFLHKNIKGRADLVLERGDEIAVVDLKWGGKTRRKNMIKNEEDLQLVLYSKLLTQDDSWAHTSYFIISDALMIGRNKKAFAETEITGEEMDHLAVNERIWRKMERTYLWRIDQITKGKIEIRREDNIEELDEIYANELLELLEMKRENAAYDDYTTLVNLVE